MEPNPRKLILCGSCGKIGVLSCGKCVSDWYEYAGDYACPECNESMIYGKNKNHCAECKDRYYYKCQQCNKYYCGCSLL